jgi:hypothetical protein
VKIKSISTLSPLFRAKIATIAAKIKENIKLFSIATPP